MRIFSVVKALYLAVVRTRRANKDRRAQEGFAGPYRIQLTRGAGIAIRIPRIKIKLDESRSEEGNSVEFNLAEMSEILASAQVACERRKITSVNHSFNHLYWTTDGRLIAEEPDSVVVTYSYGGSRLRMKLNRNELLAACREFAEVFAPVRAISVGSAVDTSGT